KMYVAWLLQVDENIKKALSPHGGRQFIAFHDAFQYFDNRYNFEPAGIVLLEPGQPLAAKHVEEILQVIRKKKPRCMFYEPQFDTKMIKQISPEEHIKLVELDPLGSTRTLHKNLYPELIANVGPRYLSCAG